MSGDPFASEGATDGVVTVHVARPTAMWGGTFSFLPEYREAKQLSILQKTICSMLVFSKHKGW